MQIKPKPSHKITNDIKVHIIKANKKWNSVKFAKKVFCRDILKMFIECNEFLQYADSIEVSLLLTDDNEMQALNKRFLNTDKPTNVLAFPEKDLNYKNISHQDFIGNVILGDIAFGLETIEREATHYKITIQNHFTHLLIHAILHLVGFDHETQEDYAIMKKSEIKLLNTLHINRPPLYEE